MTALLTRLFHAKSETRKPRSAVQVAGGGLKGGQEHMVDWARIS